MQRIYIEGRYAGWSDYSVRTKILHRIIVKSGEFYHYLFLFIN